MQDSFNRAEAIKIRTLYGAALDKMSKNNSLFFEYKQQAMVILSALNSIADGSQFQPESIDGTTINDPSTAIRTLAGSASFANASRLGVLEFDLKEFQDACGVVTEPQKSRTDIEIATTQAIASICGSAKDPKDFGETMYNIITDYLKDVGVDTSIPHISNALANLADKSAEAYEQYVQNKNDMGPIDQLIDFVKSIFGMDIDSKFLESTTKALGEATVEANLPEDKVFGKHTAAVLAERGGQSKGGGITGP